VFKVKTRFPASRAVDERTERYVWGRRRFFSITTTFVVIVHGHLNVVVNFTRDHDSGWRFVLILHCISIEMCYNIIHPYNIVYYYVCLWNVPKFWFYHWIRQLWILVSLKLQLEKILFLSYCIRRFIFSNFVIMKILYNT